MKSRMLIGICATILVVGCTSSGPSEPTHDNELAMSSKNKAYEQIQGIVRYWATGGRTFGQKGHVESGVSQGGSHGMDESGTLMVMCYPSASWCYTVDHLGHWVDVREGLVAGAGSPFSVPQQF